MYSYFSITSLKIYKSCIIIIIVSLNPAVTTLQVNSYTTVLSSILTQSIASSTFSANIARNSVCKLYDIHLINALPQLKLFVHKQ